MINRKFFFDQVRVTLFGGSLRQPQVDGLLGILDEWEARHAKKDDRWLAYMMATVHHETDRKIQPIDEYGGKAYFKRMYDVTGDRPTLAKKNGNTTPGDGVKYHGRGFVQLTWKDNYARMSKVTGVDLVKHPEKAKEIPVATKIMFHGMMKGSFTGRKLSDYFNKDDDDWVEARRIINRLDKAHTIAGFGKDYYAAISYTTG